MEINSYKKFVLSLICLLGGWLYAQQSPQYTQYMYNTLNINPGYTGSNGRLEATLLHRSQWTGIDGAPKTQSLSVHGKLSDKVGLGFSAFNDNIGPANLTNINATFGYHLYISPTARLGLGLNAGIDILDIDWSKGRYYDGTDPTFNSNANELKPTIGAGAFFYTYNWYAGISVPNFVNTSFYSDEDEVVYNTDMHYYLIGGYVFDISPSVLLKPTFMAKITSGAPVTYDISANVLLQNTFNLGVGYRFDDALSALVGFHLNQSFFVGYAFDYSLSDLNKYDNGSHEIILRFAVPEQRQRARSPRFF